MGSSYQLQFDIHVTKANIVCKECFGNCFLEDLIFILPINS